MGTVRLLFGAILVSLSAQTAAPNALYLLIAEDVSDERVITEKWLNSTMVGFLNETPELAISFRVLWINQSSFFLLALDPSGLSGNWTAVIDLTDDCYLAGEPEFQSAVYLSMSFCSPEVPSIAPSSLHFLRAAMDVLRSLGVGLDHLALVLDETEEIIQDGTAAILNGSALTMIPLYNSSLIDMVLRRLVKESASLATVVIGTSRQNEHVLQTACSLESLLASVYWVVIATDWQEVGCPPCDLNSVIYLRPPWGALNASFYDNLPDDVRSVISKKKTFQLWDSLRTVVHLSNRSISDSVTKIRTASGELIFENDRLVHGLQLDVFEVSCQRNASNTSVIGTWLNGTMEWYGKSRLTETKAYKLRVATFHEPPFVFRKVDENGNVTYDGYAINVLDEIMKALNDQYEIYEVADKTYGSLLPSGQWNGLVGELVHGAADIAIGPISVTAERESVVDFTTPYYDFAGIQIVMKKTVNKPNMFAFSDVFAKDVWLCWAGVLCTTAILIFVFERFSPFSTRNAVGESVTGTVYTFKECWWFVVTSFTMSGSESTPRPMSTRLLVAGFWFFCSIMMSTYTANLAAHLTLSRLTDPVESLDDLAAQSEIQYSALEGSTVQTYFLRMANIERNFYALWKQMSYGDNTLLSLKEKNYAVWDYPLGDKYQNIWKHMADHKFLNSSKEGMDRVMKGKFAFFHDSPMIKYEMSQRCDLEVIGSQFSTKPYAFALRENSAHTKKISSKILELQQERRLDSLKEKWWNTSRNCETTDGNDGLTFETVAGIFIVMAAGTVFSIIVLAVELTCKKISERRKRETDGNMKEQNGLPVQLTKSDGSCSTLSSRL